MAQPSDSGTPPGAFPNSALGNVTISGSATVLGALGLTGSPSVTGATTITGGSTGTLTNSPHSGNPFTFLEITVNGTVGAIPVYAIT